MQNPKNKPSEERAVGRTRVVESELGHYVPRLPVLTFARKVRYVTSNGPGTLHTYCIANAFRLPGDPPVTTSLKGVGNIKTVIIVVMSFPV